MIARGCLPTAVLVVAAAARPALAELPRPAALAEVRVDERIGQRVPFDLLFTDATGRRALLGSVFDGRTPVVLVLAYVRCQMLCSLVLHGTTDLVRELPLALGRDYRIVTVSIDPQEQSASAAARRRELVRRSGRDEDEPAWTYLVGAERPIRALADSLGFHYAWDQRTEQFAHPAVLFVLTPDGRIARYFHGVQFAPLEVAASLRAAAAGQLGATSIAEAVLGCFRFDPAARAHREQIDRYLRIGASVVLLVLGSSVLLLFLWERRRRSS